MVYVQYEMTTPKLQFLFQYCIFNASTENYYQAECRPMIELHPLLLFLKNMSYNLHNIVNALPIIHTH